MIRKWTFYASFIISIDKLVVCYLESCIVDAEVSIFSAELFNPLHQSFISRGELILRLLPTRCQVCDLTSLEMNIQHLLCHFVYHVAESAMGVLERTHWPFQWFYMSQKFESLILNLLHLFFLEVSFWAGFGQLSILYLKRKRLSDPQHRT